MLNGIDLRNGLPAEFRLFLCKPDTTTIAELKSAYDREISINYGSLNQLSFKIPYSILDGNMQSIRNPLVDLINGDFLIRYERNNDTEFFVISRYINNMADGKKFMQVQAHQRAYELRYKILKSLKVTYKLYDPLDTANSLMHQTVLAKSDWTINYVDSNFALKYRTFDVTNMDLLTFLNQVADSYNSIIAFDSINKTISFYQEQNYGVDDGLTIDERYLKSLEETENHDDVVTRLYCYGKDNLSISSVNPSGDIFIDDFSYYMYPFAMDGTGAVTASSQYMSDSLCIALTNYNALVSSKQSQFTSLLSQRKTLIDSLIPKRTTIVGYFAEIDSIIASINVNIKNNLDISSLNTQKSNKLAQIKTTQSEMDVINSNIASIESAITVNTGATTSGNIKLTIGGKDIIVAVLAGDSAGTVAGKINTQFASLYPAYANDNYIILTPAYTSTVATNVLTVDYFTSKAKADTPIVFTDTGTTGVGVSIVKTDRGVDNQISTLKNLLSSSNNFTAAQINELQKYIKEKVWQDTKYVDANDLYTDGKARLAQVSQPIMAYRINSINFTKALNTPQDWYRLKIGSIVTVKYADFGINFDIKVKSKLNHYAAKKLKAKVINIKNNIDQNSIDITIANHKDIKSGFLKLGDLLKNSQNFSSILDVNKYGWDSGTSANDTINNFINNQYDATKQAVLAGNNNAVVVDKRGITITDPTDANKIIRITNGVLAMSNDGGNTYKLGITADKVVAESIIGKIGILATIRTNQIIIGDAGEKLGDGVINSATTWNNAVANANAANALLADLSNDNKLTAVEKQQVKQQWDVIVSEKPTIDAQADTYTIATEKTTYDNAYNSLNTYVTPLLADLTTTSDIVGTTFRSNFKTYFDARTALLKKISDTAKTLADNAQTTANNAVAKGTVYNGVVIDATNGIVVTSSNNLSKTILNATNGIKIQKNIAGTWTDQFYADTNGNLFLSGTISGGNLTGAISSTGTITGGTIQGATFQTGSSGSRIVISLDGSGPFGTGGGLRMYNQSNQQEGLWAVPSSGSGGSALNAGFGFDWAGNSLFIVSRYGGSTTEANISFHGYIGYNPGYPIRAVGDWYFQKIIPDGVLDIGDVTIKTNAVGEWRFKDRISPFNPTMNIGDTAVGFNTVNATGNWDFKSTRFVLNTSATASAGSNSMPTLCANYWTIDLNGTTYKIPLFNA